MLIELGVVEQRHRAVLEVMEGLPVTEVAASYGVTRQTLHPGCAGMRREGSPTSPTAPAAPRPAPIAWLPRSRHGSWPCGPSTRAGDRGRCSSPRARGALPRSPAAPRSTAAYSATA